MQRSELDVASGGSEMLISVLLRTSIALALRASSEPPTGEPMALAAPTLRHPTGLRASSESPAAGVRRSSQSSKSPLELPADASLSARGAAATFRCRSQMSTTRLTGTVLHTFDLGEASSSAAAASPPAQTSAPYLP